MSRKYYTYLFLLLFSTPLYAQQTAIKLPHATMNLELMRYIGSQHGSAEMTDILVQGDVNQVKTLVNNDGGLFKFSIGNISSVRVPLNAVYTIASSPLVKRIEAMHGNGIVLDAQTDTNANITPVKQGAAPLPHGYTGKGVIVGIIDDGIDFTHPDFKDSLGHTRIKYIWSQNTATGGTTPSFGYGQEWDSAAIETNCPYQETQIYSGHGSIVSGVATGNGLAVHNYYGIATKADIIAVDLNMGNNFLNDLVDAANYIYSKAAALNEPCVINVSLGTYSGSHDGHDLPAKAIDSLITAQNGRALVCAAGNAGNIQVHLGYDVQPDSSFTWFKYSNTFGMVLFDLWGSMKDMANMQFAIGADNTSPFAFRGRTPYYNMLSDFNLSSGVDSVSYNLVNGVDTIGKIKIYAETQDSSYHLVFNILTDSTTYYWRFITNGSGHFDLWAQPNSPTFTNTSNMVRTGLPSSATFPDITRYMMPDRTQNIVSSFTCSDKTIAVANYTNKNTWLNYTLTTESVTDTPGQHSLTSSIGPSRDGKWKPDIAAPGDYTFGSGLLSLMPTFISSNPQKVGIGSMHIIDGGTSLASPVVTGIVALYLQKNPTAAWSEIKNAILFTAKHDSFTTTNLPNIKWGYGKVDAFHALNAYGCTDPFAKDYDSLSVFNDGSCTYATSAITINSVNPILNNYPNPFNGNTLIQYVSPTPFTTGLIVVTDMLGKEVSSIQLKGQSGNITFDASNLQSGVYFYQLVTDGKVVETKKMVVF